MKPKPHKLTCHKCGKDFFVTTGDKNNGAKFCSRSCSAKYKQSIFPQTGSLNPNYKEDKLTQYQKKLKWRNENPEKAKAHDAVTYARRRGIIIPKPCEVCGSEKVDAHHDDYSKPLDVRWLCRRHHNGLPNPAPIHLI